jgi:hypothetical protein
MKEKKFGFSFLIKKKILQIELRNLKKTQTTKNNKKKIIKFKLLTQLYALINNGNLNTLAHFGIINFIKKK